MGPTMPDRNQYLDAQQIATLKSEQAYYDARASAQIFATEDFLKTVREQAAGADESRVYSFYDGVDDSSCLRCMATLTYWARQHHPNGAPPFTLELTSGGGSVIDGFALIDTVRSLQAAGYTINTVAKGWVASMGAVLFQVGTVRSIGRRASLLLHEASAQVAGKLSDIEDKQKFTADLTRSILTLLAERSTLTAEQIKERTDRREWYLNAEQAIELGFADEFLREVSYGDPPVKRGPLSDVTMPGPPDPPLHPDDRPVA